MVAERTLILIPCCKEKNTGGTLDYSSKSCIINYLSGDAARKLMELRRLIATNLGEEKGPDVGFEIQASRIRYMKAYERYRGQLYSRISRESWEKLNRCPGLSLIIVSALYGY